LGDRVRPDNPVPAITLHRVYPLTGLLG